MPSVPTSELVALQANTQNIRNLCVLAHVDHGKTTLSDALISSNGIISDKLAGKIRYMDNRKDEQLREITMKSSAISLLYRNAKEEPFLINLIDSPGHVDFSGEVSSAVRLCDGGFLVVDAVEGVCVQTDTVMRQAWKEKLKPVLVINKIDRLFMELQMGPDEAAEHLKKLLAVVNVSVATLMLEQQYEKGNQKNSDNAKAAATEEAFQRSQRPKGPPVSSSSSSSSSSEGVTSFTVSLEGDSSWKLEEVNDDDIYFSPELGNVLFCSAIDGWGFRTTQFAEFYSKKMGFSKGALEKALWGEHYFDPKTKKVFGNSRGGKLKQMFTELVMRPLHQLYDSTVGSRDETKLKKICSVLGLSLTDRILGQLQTDPRYILTQVARQWIPLSPALIEMAIEHLPSPVDGQKSRADTLFRPLPSTISQEYRDEYERVKESVAKCESHADLQANPESSEAPVVIYISKMFTAPLGYGSSVQDSGPRIAMPKARKPIFTAASHSSASPAPAAAVTPAPAPANPLSGPGSGSGEGSSLSSSGSSSASSESEETEKHLQGLRSKVMTGERFVGFARIFSGTVKIGQMLHVYGPKYDPLFPDKHHALVQCEELYLLMGRGLEPLREVPAGNVFGISGSQLPRHILKTGSLSTSACCPIFSDMVFSKPIMRVAVEPLVPAEMPILIEGLKLLNQADASVEIMVQESGEHVIVASGEVHLERCVTDLKEMFAPIELKFSSPIVGFREGLIQDPTRTGGIVIQPKDYLYAQMNLETIQSKDLLKEAKRGQIAFKKSLAQAMTRNKACVVTVRAIPLPDCIRDALELLGPQIKQVFIDHPNKSGAAFHSLQQKLLKSFIEAGNQWSSEFDKIWSIGPKRMGPNILFNHIGQICNSPFWKSLCSTEEAVRITLSSEDQGDVEKKKEEKPERAEGEEEEEEEEDPEAGLTEEEKWTISKIQEFEPSIVSAFQLTTQSGPLCEEPMMGVAFFIESLTIKNLPAEKMDDGGPIKGQVMSAVKEAGRQAFSKLPNRLIEPYYDCQLQVSTEQYGNACSVLSRRRAKIVGEELKEGTNIFILNAKLPVVSSFGLALEMMKKTSGAANAQLKFSHWELLDLDPDFVPTTAEELEEHGTNTGGIAPNLAKQLINDVRKRKGLYVDEQLVEHADKQRTLSKNK